MDLQYRFVDPSKGTDTFWKEKAIALVDGLQMFAMLWIFFQPFLPYEWNFWMKWVLVGNFDILRLGFCDVPKYGTLMTLSGGHPMFIPLVVGFFVFPWVVMGIWKGTFGRGRFSWDDKRRKKAEKIILLGVYLIFLPYNLMGFFLMSAEDMETLPGLRYALFFYSVILSGVFLLFFYLKWYQNLIFREETLHRQNLIQCEISYLIGVSNFFLMRHYIFLKPFFRSAGRVFYPLFLSAFKFLMFLILTTYFVDAKMQVAASLLVLSLLAVSLYVSISPIYLSSTTSSITAVIFWALFIHSIVATLKVIGISNSALMLSYNFSKILFFLFVLFAFIIIALLIYSPFSKDRAEMFRYLLQMTYEKLEHICEKEEKLIEEIFYYQENLMKMLNKKQDEIMLGEMETLCEQCVETCNTHLPSLDSSHLPTDATGLEWHLMSLRTMFLDMHDRVLETANGQADVFNSDEWKLLMQKSHQILKRRSVSTLSLLFTQRKKKVLLKLLSLSAMCGRWFSQRRDIVSETRS